MTKSETYYIHNLCETNLRSFRVNIHMRKPNSFIQTCFRIRTYTQENRSREEKKIGGRGSKNRDK